MSLDRVHDPKPRPARSPRGRAVLVFPNQSCVPKSRTASSSLFPNHPVLLHQLPDPELGQTWHPQIVPMSPDQSPNPKPGATQCPQTVFMSPHPSPVFKPGPAPCPKTIPVCLNQLPDKIRRDPVSPNQSCVPRLIPRPLTGTDSVFPNYLYILKPSHVLQPALCALILPTSPNQPHDPWLGQSGGEGGVRQRVSA